MLVCKGEDLYSIILSSVRGVHMESSYSKQQAYIFQSRMKIALVSKQKLRDPLGCRALQICQVLPTEELSIVKLLIQTRTKAGSQHFQTNYGTVLAWLRI